MRDHRNWQNPFAEPREEDARIENFRLHEPSFPVIAKALGHKQLERRKSIREVLNRQSTFNTDEGTVSKMLRTRSTKEVRDEMNDQDLTQKKADLLRMLDEEPPYDREKFAEKMKEGTARQWAQLQADGSIAIDISRWLPGGT